MSYILDALKKAEAENNPDVRTSLVVQDRQNRKQQIIQYLMIVALIGNALLLFWLFAPLSWNTPAADLPEVSTPGAAPAVAAAGSSPPATSGSNVLTQPATVAAPPQAPVAKPAKPVRTTLSGLPPAARSRFPGLSFSTHVYATDPATRAVVVNGQRLTEGDRLGSLQLTEITEDGVVFRFENYLVSVSVLEQWD